jgi:flagellin
MSTINVRNQTLADAQKLGRIHELLGKSLSRLSSGVRITSPSSDPAGVGSIGKLEGEHKRSKAASVNVQNASSLVQSSVGFLASMGDIVTRMSELAALSSDGLKSASDISLYQTEFKQLQDQLRLTIGGTTAEIGGTTAVNAPLGSFNGNPLYGPNAAGISIASSPHSGENIIIPETNLRDGAMLGIIQQDASGNYLLSATSLTATTQLDGALDEIANERSVLGGVGSRLEFAAGTLTVASQNITSAVSRIQDTDVATESTRLSKLNILLESGTAMLSQANQAPQAVLKLLQA